MDIDNIKEKIDDLIHNKPQVFFSITGILMLFMLGLIILLIQTSRKPEVVQQKTEFTANAPVMIPDEPNVEKNYYQYRKTPEKWSQKDLEDWFTYPDEKTMNQLEKVNNNLVNDITGVAP